LDYWGCLRRDESASDGYESAVQNATSKADHEALAQHDENVAKDMQLADEHKKLLSQYQSKSYLYGRQAEDFKAHCARLIDVYEKAAEENPKTAKMHRQM
jgi:hypothetical protein